MSIDIAAMMDALRLMAVEEGVVIGKPNILDFHEEVLRSLEKYGRAHKLGIMLGYKRHERPSAQGLFVLSGLLPGHHRGGEQPLDDAGGQHPGAQPGGAGGLELLRVFLGPDHVQEPEPGDGGQELVVGPGGAAPGGHVSQVSPLPAFGPGMSEG
jgi:hypothetical protein